MKIEKRVLQDALKKIRSVIPAKPQLEALGGCLCKDGWITATDTSTTARIRVAGADECCIIPQKAFPLLESLRDGEIEITRGKGDIRIRQGEIKARYLTWDPDIFPAQETDIKETGTVIDAGILIESMSRVQYAIKPGASVDKMSSMYLMAKDGELHAVGLNGYLIAWDRQPCDGDFKLMVPIAAAKKIMESGFDGDMQITATGNRATFSSDSCEVTTNLVEGEYFNYEKLFTMKIGMAFTADRKSFIEAVRRAGYIVEKQGDKNPIELDAEGNKLTILTVSMDASYHENLDIDPKKGDLNIRIGFNPSFLLKTLQAFDGDEVVVGMVSAKYPAVLREKGSKFLASVMPCILRTAAQADQDEEEAKAS